MNLSFGKTQGRLEDARMLRGQGRYVSDWSFENQAYGCFLRSDRGRSWRSGSSNGSNGP